jgi:hypothetical protein
MNLYYDPRLLFHSCIYQDVTDQKFFLTYFKNLLLQNYSLEIDINSKIVIYGFENLNSDDLENFDFFEI